MIGKITRIAVTGPTALEVVWDDGHSATIDIGATIAQVRSVAPLLDSVEFAQAKLTADGWSVEWPSGVDFGAAQLRRWAGEQKAPLVHGAERK